MERVSGKSHPYYQSPCEASGSCAVPSALGSPEERGGLGSPEEHHYYGQRLVQGVGACGSPAYGVPAGVGACGSPYYGGAVQGHVGAPRGGGGGGRGGHGGHGGWGGWGGWGGNWWGNWGWPAYAYNYSNYYQQPYGYGGYGQDNSTCYFDQRSGRYVCQVWDGAKWVIVG